MPKRKWDGRFSEAYWVARDNPVEELIENSGRILRESTSDGYTHDIVYRAGYISEDYYFPNPDRGNGHDHYELHSDGNIVINGKRITGGGVDMAGRGKVLSRSSESTRVRRQETEQTQSEFKRIVELGKKFEADRAELDRQIEAIEMSDATEEYKQKARAKYEYAVEKLKEKYDRDIKEALDEEDQKLIDQAESAKESSLEHKRVAEELKKTQLEVADVGMSDAVVQAEQESQEMANIEKSISEKRKLLKEQADIQRRNVRAQRLRGRN